MRALAFAGSKVAGSGVAAYGGRLMRVSVLCAIAAFFVSALSLCAEDTAMVRAADGFQFPVGPNGTAEGYYIARGYRPNGHLGEDWNGVHGGDTDLGDPVYATANGFVTFARNYHVGWGNVVILRHAYYEGSTLKYCDSLYGHLLDFSVQEGQQVRRGQQIGRIGNNFGMYEAHLHFEMRKNLQIGMFRSSFLRDFSNYYTPNQFVADHHFCPNGNHMVPIPINTYPPVAPPVIAGPHVESPVFGPPPAGAPSRFAKISPLPPAGSASLVPTPTPAAKVVSRISTSTPAPTTPEPKATKSKAVAAVPPPTPTPAPTPIVRSFRTGTNNPSVASASPTPASSAKQAKTTATASASEPAVKIDAASATETAAAAPASSTKLPKAAASAATPTPTSISSRKSSSGASAAAVPTTKSSQTTASVSTPAPAKKGALTPDQVAAAPKATPTPAPVAANKTRKSPTATPIPQPTVAVKGDPQIITSDPLLPAPTAKDTPIRRTGSTYKVDRFEDLRKAGD